jgi:hypothetical protein
VKRRVVWVPLLFVVSGCTHSVHQVAMGGLDDIPSGARISRVEADTEQDVVLYITDNTDYADRAYSTLLARCPDGELRAIQMRSSTSHGFLSFTNRVKATAMCVR